ncbi:hypothetical protein FHG87_006790 [Trinorchestia longiramus]|nr:hypothetical protein FHG87_006790 [Trinorchestia longiramus]
MASSPFWYGEPRMIDFALDVHDLNTRTRHKNVLIYIQANFELIKEELSSLDYESQIRNKNAEECNTILEEKMSTATEHDMPTKLKIPTNNPPWFSQEIKNLIN